MKRAFIAAAKRTPIGSFSGLFKNFTAPQLATFPLKKILEETNVEKSKISEVILGNVLSTGLG